MESRNERILTFPQLLIVQSLFSRERESNRWGVYIGLDTEGGAMRTPPTIERQYETYIDHISNRKRNPVTKTTLKCYRCYWRKWIRPVIGKMEISEVRNGQMKKLVEGLIEAGLGPSAIAGVTHVVKAIVSSAIDEEGNEIYPIRWNSEFINAPPVEKKVKKQPVIY
jgi:hypothetical protein